MSSESSHHAAAAGASAGMPAASGFAARARAGLRRLLARRRHEAGARTSPHGIWSPGVRWMRNLDIARKSLVVGLVTALPLAVLVLDVWTAWHERVRAADRAALAQMQIAAIADEAGTIDVIALRLWLAAYGAAGATEATDRHEAVHFAALTQALADGRGLGETENAELQRMSERLTATRRAWLALAAPADHDAQAPADDALQSRQRALRELTAELAEAHRHIGYRWWSELADERGELMLFVGVAQAGFELGQLVDRLLGAGLAVQQGRVSPSTLHEMAGALSQAERLLARSRAPVQTVQTLQLLDTSEVDRHFGAIRAFVQLGTQLELAAARAPALPQHGGGRVSVDDGFVRAAAQAQSAAHALHAQAIDQLGRRVAARRADLAHELAARATLLLALVLLAAYLMVCSFKVLRGGLQTVVQQLDRLGQGDLSIRPRGLGRDEIGQALHKLGDSTARMSRLFEAVTQGVAAVSHASREVASGNAGLSGRSGEVKQSIDSVTERATVFSAAMDRCAQGVEQAAEHVRAMRLDAQRSRKAMDSLRERMQALQSMSREISHAVRLVENVAFQTKLLSLNASVESARAGPAGRGFAVVAQEVRALAQRSEAAARQIHRILGGSVAEIDEGHRMTERASQAVTHTDEEIHAVDRIMVEIVHIARESMEQSQQVLGISRGVEQTVRGNTQLVDQLAEASTALRDQGDALRRSLHHFVLS